GRCAIPATDAELDRLDREDDRSSESPRRTAEECRELAVVALLPPNIQTGALINATRNAMRIAVREIQPKSRSQALNFAQEPFKLPVTRAFSPRPAQDMAIRVPRLTERKRRYRLGTRVHVDLCQPSTASRTLSMSLTSGGLARCFRQDTIKQQFAAKLSRFVLGYSGGN